MAKYSMMGTPHELKYVTEPSTMTGWPCRAVNYPRRLNPANFPTRFRRRFGCIAQQRSGQMRRRSAGRYSTALCTCSSVSGATVQSWPLHHSALQSKVVLHGAQLYKKGRCRSADNGTECTDTTDSRSWPSELDAWGRQAALSTDLQHRVRTTCAREPEHCMRAQGPYTDPFAMPRAHVATQAESHIIRPTTNTLGSNVRQHALGIHQLGHVACYYSAT